MPRNFTIDLRKKTLLRLYIEPNRTEIKMIQLEKKKFWSNAKQNKVFQAV